MREYFREEEEEYKTGRFLEALKTIMGMEAGRAVVFYILDSAGLSVPLYFGRSGEQLAYAAGRRTLAEELLHSIRSLDGGLELEMKMRYEARARPEHEKLEDDLAKMTGGDEIVL